MMATTPKPTAEWIPFTFHGLELNLWVQHDFGLPGSPPGPDEILRIDVSVLASDLEELEEALQ